MSADRVAVSLAFCFLTLTASLKAQDSQPAPPKPVTHDAATSAEPEAYRVKVQVRRVVLDVVVTDAKGNPVERLKQDDFKVMEDGVAQPLRFFDVHDGAAPGPSQQALDLHLPSDTFSNLTLAPPDKPVTVLLYDMLDTPHESFASAHQALVKFIRDQKSSTRIAIFVLTDRLHMVQGFTDDETRLIQAVDSKGATTQAAPLRFLTIADYADKLLVEAALKDTINVRIRRNQITLQAFKEIAQFVSALPGRKNLIWMSGIFPSGIFDSRAGTPDGIYRNLLRIRRQLSESRVAVYPVDVRGLQADPQLSAAAQGTEPPDVTYFGMLKELGHGRMNEIAESTGGRAFYNTNGLREAMDTAVRQGSDYYTLTYEPTNILADGGERKIKVVLTHPGCQLSYRTSYLAEDASHPDPPISLALDMSLQHGAPNSSRLFFEARVKPVGNVTVASIEEARSIETSWQTNARGSFAKTASGKGSGQLAARGLLRRDAMRVQHYEIDLAMIGRQLEMPPAQSGEYASNMRFALAAYAGDGELLNELEFSVNNPISEAQYRKIVSDGYQASMPFAVPEGAVSLRIAVRDEIGQRLGTLEISLPSPGAQKAKTGDSR